MDYAFETLPDLLAPGLSLVFVGINPSVYAVERGHYFARPANRFWPAFSRSRLSEPVRQGLGRDDLRPEDDRLLPAYGFGFTDLIKRPTRATSDLRSSEYRNWAPNLRARLIACAPGAVCFHGLTGFRPFLRYALEVEDARADLGPQRWRIAGGPIFVVPNPSPANARYRLDDLVAWYDRLADFLERQSSQASCRISS
jgi:TDG/mug DNA glycosylase family protein